MNTGSSLLDPRSPNMDPLTVKKYQRIFLVIVDDISEDRMAILKTGKDFLSEHENACFQIRQTFENYTAAMVEGIPANTSPQEFTQYLTQMSATSTENDLFIIYYHGDAGGEDTEWRWIMNPPSRTISAYNLIESMHQIRADCMFLLDCFVQDRFQTRWAKGTNTVEILARSQRMQSRNEHVQTHENDFTSALTRAIEAFVRQAEMPPPRRTPAMRTIAQMMGKDRSSYARSRRIGITHARRGNDQAIIRFKADPVLVWQNRTNPTSKMEFFGHLVNGPRESVHQHHDEGELEDEGFVDWSGSE